MSLRKKIAFDLITTLVIIFVCVFFFGQKLTHVLWEFGWFLACMAVVVVIVGGIFAWGLSRAMNPPRKPPGEV